MSFRAPLTIFLIFFVYFFCKAETLDSLLAVEKKQKGLEHAITLNRISVELRNTDPSRCDAFARKALNEALQAGDDKTIGDAYNNIGYVHNAKGEYPQAIELYLKSFLYRQKAADSIGMANSLSNIGLSYRKLDEFEKAFDYYQRALALKERLNKPAETMTTLNNIGGLFYYQQNFPKARYYYERTLKIALELKDSTMIGAEYNNIGLILDEEKKPAEALMYLEKSLAIRKKIQDDFGVAVVYNNFGRVNEHLGKLDLALGFYSDAARIYLSMEIYPEYGSCLYNIGNVQLTQKKYKEAIASFEKSKEYAKKVGNRISLRDSYNGLGIGYHYIGKHDLSYSNLINYIELTDSIFDETTLDRIRELDTKYQSEKKMQENTLLRQENELKDLQHEQTRQRQRNILYLFLAGLAVVLALATIFFVRYNTKRKSEAQLQLYNREILRQKALVDDKNKEITDSIHYAQRIQGAIIPLEEEFVRHFQEAFVFFRPKDIVSGDFYWISVKGDEVFFAAVDCTGHGVPGGFMSMLGASLLDEVINDKNIEEPADALDLLRAKIILALKQSSPMAEGSMKNVVNYGQVQDGMDMALCRLNTKTRKLTFAGANNDLYLIRNKELKIFDASYQPVGIYFGELNQFTQHDIQLQPGDKFYIFTDGYADQFGGPKGKKFKYKQLQEVLLNCNDKSMKEQKEILAKRLDDWKGGYVQIDDICLIGVMV